MRAHLVQPNTVWEEKPANYAAVRRLLDAVASSAKAVHAGDLVVLPEMFDTGFSCNIQTTADTDGATLKFIQTLARELGVFVHGARTVLGPDKRGRNQALVADPAGKIICTFEKLHLFPLGSVKESEVFAPGAGVTTYSWTSAQKTLRLCPAICYDLRFPEQFRVGLELGAEGFVVTSSWPSSREEHRRTLSIARAIENQAFVLSVNRCGSDPNLEYAGGTLAVSPRGEILAQLADQEGVLSVDLDLGDLRRWRNVFPAWKDVRPVSRAPGKES